MGIEPLECRTTGEAAVVVRDRRVLKNSLRRLAVFLVLAVGLLSAGAGSASTTTSSYTTSSGANQIADVTMGGSVTSTASATPLGGFDLMAEAESSSPSGFVHNGEWPGVQNRPAALGANGASAQSIFSISMSIAPQASQTVSVAANFNLATCVSEQSSTVGPLGTIASNGNAIIHIFLYYDFVPFSGGKSVTGHRETWPLKGATGPLVLSGSFTGASGPGTLFVRVMVEVLVEARGTAHARASTSGALTSIVTSLP